MKTPHVHAEAIRAWADGAEIEVTDGIEPWTTTIEPFWRTDCEYRIKPEPTPDVVYYATVGKVGDRILHLYADKKYCNNTDVLKFTFHGETKELIKAEVI